MHFTILLKRLLLINYLCMDTLQVVSKIMTDLCETHDTFATGKEL